MLFTIPLGPLIYIIPLALNAFYLRTKHLNLEAFLEMSQEPKHLLALLKINSKWKLLLDLALAKYPINLYC